MKVIAIVTLCLAICCELQALPTTGSCQRKYTDVLEQIVSLQKECDEPVLKDCCAVKTLYNALHVQSQSVFYTINRACDTSETSFRFTQTQEARCDMKSDKGGWHVIFRRDKTLNPSTYVSFDRTWTEYEDGFGDLETEFWYGLREMHCLTQEDVDMRLDITFTNGTSIVWTYGSFKVDGPETNYRLRIGEAVGSPGTHSPDAITRHFKSGGTSFTTKDRDNDGYRTNCATDSGHSGGWWWHGCGWAHLTRSYSSDGGMRWHDGRSYNSVSFVEMKIRPKSCQVTQESCS